MAGPAGDQNLYCTMPPYRRQYKYRLLLEAYRRDGSPPNLARRSLSKRKITKTPKGPFVLALLRRRRRRRAPSEGRPPPEKETNSKETKAGNNFIAQRL